jgi:hypothetical protein
MHLLRSWARSDPTTAEPESVFPPAQAICSSEEAPKPPGKQDDRARPARGKGGKVGRLRC